MKKNLSLVVAVFATWGVYAQTLQDGINQLENENYTAARKTFNQLIAKDQSNTDAFFYLGESYYVEDKPDSAKIQWNRGIELNGKNTLLLSALGKTALDADNIKDVTRYFEKAIGKGKDATAFYAVGNAYMNAKKPDYPKAAENYTKARDLDTKNPKYWIAMGDAYLAQNKSGDAMSSYESAVNKDPKNAEVLMKMARIWMRANQAEQAITNLEKCITLQPDYAPAYKDLIEVYGRQGQYSKLPDLLKKYTALAGDDIPARMRYVKFLTYKVKDYKTAISEAQKVIQDAPKDPELYTMYRWLGYAQVENNDNAAAIQSLNTFFTTVGNNKIYPSDYDYMVRAAKATNNNDLTTKYMEEWGKIDSTKLVEILDQKAKNYYEAKMYKEAAEAYKAKVAKAKPNYLDYYYWGMSHLKNKEYNQADAVFAEYDKIWPSDPTGSYYRAKCQEYNDPDRSLGLAKPYYEKTIEIAKAKPDKYLRNLTDAYLYLAYYHQAKGDIATARTHYQKVLEYEPTNAKATEALQSIGQ
jgi:tetratricopeptide (TPR) repeat protein